MAWNEDFILWNDGFIPWYEGLLGIACIAPTDFRRINLYQLSYVNVQYLWYFDELWHRWLNLVCHPSRNGHLAYIEFLCQGSISYLFFGENYSDSISIIFLCHCFYNHIVCKVKQKMLFLITNADKSFHFSQNSRIPVTVMVSFLTAWNLAVSYSVTEHGNDRCS